MDNLDQFFNSFFQSDMDLQIEKKEEQEPEAEGSTTTTTTTDERQSRMWDLRPESSTCSVPPEVLETPEDLRIIPQIQNVISSVKLGCLLDLDSITRTTWNTEYRPKIFNALTMRIRKPRTTANIYQNGSLVCTGARSPEDSHRAARRFARILQKLGFPVRFQNFKISNVVASCTTFPVSLETLYLVHNQNCSYEPEQFHGLYLRMVPGVTAIVFCQGTLILTGAKSRDEVHKAFQIIHPVLRRFRKRP